jgi:hypothetical protein
MGKVIQIWKESLFTDPLLFIALLVTFTVSLKKFKGHPQLKMLPLYFASFILFSLLSEIFVGVFQNQPRVFNIRFERLGNLLVTVLEFFAFTYYALAITATRTFRNAIYFLSALVFLLALTLVYINYNSLEVVTHRTLNILYIIESISLLIISSFYFIDLFVSPSVCRLLNTANFWVSSGLVFYVFCTLPFTLLSDYFINTNENLYKNLYSLVYIFYIILFLMVIKGYYADN